VDAELTLLWPIADSPDVGAAEFDLLATILAEGPEARLERRVVLDQRFARQLLAGADASGACFHVTAVAACELDLAAVRPEIFAVLSELAGQGPSPAEFERARARAVARFLARMESLTARAAAVHAYLREYGVADGFQQDLARWSEATPEGVAAAARFLLTTPSHESLRLPEPRALTEGAASGARPASPGDAGADPRRSIAP
jgi:predicted Zn-dependent peptidase